MAKLGTLKWLEKTNGKLGLIRRLAMVAQGVRASAATQRRLRAGKRIRHMEVEAILPPDSPIAREAMALCEEASPPFLFNHCLRSYFWARLLNDGSQPYDDEALFTALMLHDMGLTDRFRHTGGTQLCFTAVGARMAEQLALKHLWTDRRAAIVAEAITLHLNVVVPHSHGREAQLVRTGSGGDVAGLGLDLLHTDQIEAVCSRHPRLQMKKNMRAVLKIESSACPDCRVAFLRQRMGFDGLIARAPMFSE